jgi:hypothetical protein
MIVMAREKGLKVYFRSTSKLRGVYNRVMGNLRATEVFSSRKGYTSNDAIMNAFVLWADQTDPDEVAKLLEPYVGRFQVLWSKEDGLPDAVGGPAVVVTFRDGTSLTLGGVQAEAVRRFVLNLPDGIPLYGPDDAASGRVGRPDVAPVQRKEGN